MQSSLIPRDEPEHRDEVMGLLCPRLLLSLGAIRNNMARETTVEVRKRMRTAWSALAPSGPEAASESRGKHKLLRLMLLLMELLHPPIRLPLAAFSPSAA